MKLNLDTHMYSIGIALTVIRDGDEFVIVQILPSPLQKFNLSKQEERSLRKIVRSYRSRTMTGTKPLKKRKAKIFRTVCKKIKNGTKPRKK